MEELKQIILTQQEQIRALLSRMDKLESIVKEESSKTADKIDEKIDDSTQRIIEEMERQTKAMMEALVEALRNNLTAQKEAFASIMEKLDETGGEKAQRIFQRLIAVGDLLEKVLFEAKKREESDEIMVIQDEIVNISKGIADIKKDLETLGKNDKEIGEGIIAHHKATINSIANVGRGVKTNGENDVKIYNKLNNLEKQIEYTYKMALNIYNDFGTEIRQTHSMVSSMRDRQTYGY